MTELSRRTFFFGVAATTAALAIPASLKATEFMGETIYVPLNSKLPYRAMCDFVFSAMPEEGGVDDTVQWTFSRNGTQFLVVGMNARATYRWVTLPGGEIEFNKTDIMSVTIDPIRPTTVTSINLMSDTEKDKNPLVRRKMFTESFRWRGKTLEASSIMACHFLDEGLIA